MTTTPFNRDIKAALDGKADKPISAGDLTLPQHQVFIGQSSGVAAPKSLSGDISVFDTGNMFLKAQSYLPTIFSNPPARIHFANYTLAQVNAGVTVLICPPGNRIGIGYVRIQSNGDWGTGTSVRLIGESGSQVLTIAQANMTDGAWHQLNGSGVTPGSGMQSPLVSGEDLLIDVTGSPFTGGTSLTIWVTYGVSSA